MVREREGEREHENESVEELLCWAKGQAMLQRSQHTRRDLRQK